MIGEFLVRLGITGEREVEEAARRTGRGLHDAGNEAERAGAKFASAGHGFGRFVETASHGINIVRGLSDGLGVARDFVSELIGPAVGFEALNARLEAVTGSADAAARKLQFAQGVANPSNFTFSEIADGTVTLEAFGINAERNLPMIAKLGMAFGATGEDLQTLIRGLGDLATGKFFEADLASKFGLNRDMFKERGIKFDQSGQLESSAVEVFAALEQIIESKYGNIFDKMSNTYSAKLATISDITEKYKRVIGQGILSVIGPSLDKISSVLSAVESSGVLVETVSQAAAGIGNLFGVGPEKDSIITFVAGLLSAISQIPDAVGKIGGAVKMVFDTVVANAQLTLDFMDKKIDFTIQKIGNRIGTVMLALQEISGNPFTMRERFQAAMKAGEFSDFAIESMKPKAPNLDSFDFKPYKFDLMLNQAAFGEKIKAAADAPASGVPKPTGEFLSRAPSKVEEALDEIKEHSLATARNTGKMAAPLDARREVIGGGEAAQLGVTPAELFGGAGAAGAKRTPYGTLRLEVIGDGLLARIIREGTRATISEADGHRTQLTF